MLQLVSNRDRQLIVEFPIGSGADANSRGGLFDNALMAAIHYGGVTIPELPVTNSTADHSQGRSHVRSGTASYGNAMQMASFQGQQSSIRTLIGEGAYVDARGGFCGNALNAAYFVRPCIDRGKTP